MYSLLVSPQNLPFAIALAVMLLLALLEGVMTLVGFGLSSLLDNLTPDIDFDTDIELPEVGLTTRLLGWLQIGKVPLLMLLIAFLTLFGLGGLALQSLALNSFQTLMPMWLAVIITLTFTLPLMGRISRWLVRWLPQDETEALSHDSFVGQVVTVTLGTARHNSPAQAKFTDQHGQTHYLMVAPEDGDEQFLQQSRVYLTRREGSIFRAIGGSKSSD